jgi:tetratricopeptide (TPR) repeat protein
MTAEPSEPGPSCERARAALHGGSFDEAIAAADEAIAGLLHDGLTADDFVALSLRGAAAEGLLRFARSAVARIPSLHEPLALRWEALRRAGRTAEARRMRAVCIRHFADRASVWSEAGNQALDEGQPARALQYFERCLRLRPDWTAALAGKAILFEQRKDWARALRYRKRVVEVERALERSEPVHLQRTIRYAAALGRVGRWDEAAVLLRRAVSLGAFVSLPAERPVLLRVFSRELYSPATVASLLAQAPEAFEGAAPEVAMAIREAHAVALVHEALSPRSEGERLLLSGMCAWIAGDEAGAYALLDEAEVHGADGVPTQYLLASCAAVLARTELPSIRRFAEQAAAEALNRAPDTEPPSDETLLYALLTLHPRGPAEHVALVRARRGSFTQLHFDALGGSTGSPAQLAVAAAGSEVGVELRRIVAFRATLRASGCSPLEAAASSHAALSVLGQRAAGAASGSR